jgi:hypothetical protein
LLIVFASLVALCAAGRASASQQELKLHMDDGVDLAPTLYEPSDGAAARRLPGDRALSRPRQRPAEPRTGSGALRR